MKDSANTNKVTAIERALNVMEVLHHAGREMGVNEIAQIMDEYQSTIFRAIATLQAHGYIYQNATNSKYGLGWKLYAMGNAIEQNSTLINTVMPYVKELALEFQETVNVAIRDYTKQDDYYAITICQEKGRSRLLGSSEAKGELFSCSYSSVGKALLAHSEDFSPEHAFLKEPIAYTEHTIVTAEALIRELEEVRRVGYAVDNEEQEKGLYCVGCPVLNEQENAVLAISISGYIGNMQTYGVEHIVSRLKEITRELQQILT